MYASCVSRRAAVLCRIRVVYSKLERKRRRLMKNQLIDTLMLRRMTDKLLARISDRIDPNRDYLYSSALTYVRS